MKLLFLCHRFPLPADGGGKIRALKMIEHLGRAYDVYVLSITRTDAEDAARDALKRHCREVIAPRASHRMLLSGLLRNLSLGRSLSEAYFWHSELASAVERLARENRFDAIITHCSSMAPYVERIPATVRIADFCDVDSEKWRAYASRSKGPRGWMHAYEAGAVRRLERRMASRFDHVTVAAPGELDTLVRDVGIRNGVVVTNGVDLQYFSATNEAYDPDTVCFVGRMDYLPNVDCVEWFCAEVWPRILAVRPQARFLIVGAEPPARVRALSESAGVTVTGTVDDVRPYVRRSAAMVAPLRIARGIQNKILESLAMGVPVVTSSIAARGIDPRVAARLSVADSPEGVGQAMLALMTDATLRRRMSVQGRRGVRQAHSWPAALRPLDALLNMPNVRPFGLRAAEPGGTAVEGAVRP
jgi:sugar transferase (PEP-CTERM/EpsH1 system associated)